MLGGLAALQHSCNNGENIYNPGTSPLLCKQVYRYQWWNWALEGFALLLVFFAIATGKVYELRLAIVGILAIVTVLLMDNCNNFLNGKDATASGTDLYKRVVTFFVGCLLAALANFLLILHFGWDHRGYNINNTDAPYGGYGAKNTTAMPHAHVQTTPGTAAPIGETAV